MKGPPPAATGLFAWKYWPYYLALILIILLVVLLVWAIRRRRRKKATEGETQPKIKIDLKRTWRAFLRGLPREYRRTVALYQPIVVLGSAGSGKSSLIDRCTDWRGQAAQFHPSHTEDPLLQIYHGKDVVVQELSPAVLGDLSKRTRKSLARLWKAFRGSRDPKAVVVLDAAALMTDPPDLMVKQAQLIRGKLNVLSHVLGRPAETSIALTHLDHFVGFDELASFFDENQCPLTIPLRSPEALETLPDCLDEVEAHLPAALLSRPPAAYLKMVTFFKQAPELMARMASFVRALQSPDPMAVAPEIVGLSLTSSGSATNPLTSCITDEEVEKFRPLRKHKWAAAAIGLMGIAYVGGGFLHERASIGEAHALLEDLTASPSMLYRNRARKRFFEHIEEMNHDVLSALLPSYYDDHALYKQQIYERYMEALRQRALYPRLRTFSAQPGSLKKVVYCVALIHGSADSDLGKLISSQQAAWEDALRLPGDLIADYLTYNDPSEKLDLPIDLRRFGRNFTLKGVGEQGGGVFLFQELTKAVKEPYITAPQLRRLQEDANTLLQEVEGTDQHRMLARILDLLEEEAGLRVAAAWRRKVSDLPKIDSTALRKLQELLTRQQIGVPKTERWHLGRLITEVEEIAARRSHSTAELAFTAGDKHFRLKAADWHALISRSRITLMMQQFSSEKAGEPLDAFFSTRAAYVGLTSGGGDPLFGGHGRVNGLYTKKAFDEQVKPLLDKMPAFLAKLTIDDKAKEDFSDFMVNLVDDYASAYVDDYRRFYRSFKYRRRTQSTLRYILAQFQLPTSPLKKFLASIERNTALELGEEGNKYIEPMMQVGSTFSFLQSILAKPKGGVAALDGYGSLLGQLQTDVESNAPFAPADEDDPTNALKAKLSPLGRVALSMFVGSEDSYLKLVEGWLNTSNVRPEWQRPFLEPIHITYRLGLQNVNRTVKDTWVEIHAQHLLPLRQTFPFHQKADTDTALAQIQEALHPQKAFWTTFDSMIAPVCSKKQGLWVRRNSRLGPVRLPARMLPLVNQMVQMRRKLWDKKGNPKPLTLSVKPVPLPAQRIGDFAVVLSYLQVGENTVFSFNQFPIWHEVELKWWENSTASVGAAFARAGQSKKVYRNRTVGDSMWSFFHLLNQAAGKRKTKKTWEWVITGPRDPKTTVSVHFRTKRNPWEPFQSLLDKIGSG